MGAKPSSYQSYSEVKVRLDAIADTVSDNSLPLDDALDLYEEAVQLAMRASELIEMEEPESLEGDAAQGEVDDPESLEDASIQE